MALKHVTIQDGLRKGNIEISQSNFKEEGLEERHIEDFLVDNMDLICEDNESLLVIGKQVIDNQRGRSDLTAIDSNGNLVLVEIKRDKEDSLARKEPLELQAIRYAASLAKIKTTEQLINKIYSGYIEKYENLNSELNSNELAARKLKEFLELNHATNSFNLKQRIILVASSFDDYTLSAVAWLIQNNVDISCYSIRPIKINEEVFIDINKELPVRKLEEFFTEVKDRNIKSIITRDSESNLISKRNLPRIPILFEYNLLRPGDNLSIKGYENSEVSVIDSKFVKYNDENLTFNEWGKKVTGWSSICIYDWAITKDNKTLSELRNNLLKIEEN